MKKLLPNLKVDFSDVELAEVNQHLEKFNIFFTKGDFTLLQKYALSEIVGILKQVSEVKFTKDGTISVDSIYQVSKLFGESLKAKRIKNPYPLLSILDRFVVVVLFKLEETNDLTSTEKNEILNSLFGSMDKTFFIESTSLHLVLPKAAELRKKLREKFKLEISNPSKKKRIAIPSKTNFLLQKEIGSKCPFCSNEDVAHFQTHHIDENPSNNELL